MSSWCSFPGRSIRSLSLKKSIRFSFVFFTRRHGFNKQTPSLFLRDTVKSFFLNLILEIMLYLVIQVLLRVALSLFFSPACHEPLPLHSLGSSGPAFHCFEPDLPAVYSPSFQPPHASPSVLSLRTDPKPRDSRRIPRKSRPAHRQQSTNPT